MLSFYWPVGFPVWSTMFQWVLDMKHQIFGYFSRWKELGCWCHFWYGAIIFKIFMKIQILNVFPENWALSHLFNLKIYLFWKKIFNNWCCFYLGYWKFSNHACICTKYIVSRVNLIKPSWCEFLENVKYFNEITVFKKMYILPRIM